MKMMEVTEKTIGEHTFYIRPFSAFYSANLSGELASLLTPMLGSLVPLVGGVSGDKGKEFHLEDLDMEELGPALTEAVSGLNGDKVESIMRKLILNQGNVSVCGPATEGRTEKLNEDLVNEVFCWELQDMYILCFEVVRLNFQGFFKRLGARSGNRPSELRATRKNTSDSETSMEPDFQTSN